jgi:hypothetical protein
MSNSLAKKFDKIVSKLGSKHKDTKSSGNETNDTHSNQDDTVDGNGESPHESILQRMKGHLGHTHASAKHEHHPQTEAAPSSQITAEDLKDSPFKGKYLKKYFYKMINMTINSCNSQYMTMNRYIFYQLLNNSLHISFYRCGVLVETIFYLFSAHFLRSICISCHVHAIEMSLTCRVR